MFFNKYFFAKVGRRKHTGKFLMLQFYKSLLQFYKKQENRPYTRLYGRFSYLRLSTYSSQAFRSEHCLRSRFAHSYITVISRIHYRQHLVCLLSGAADGLPTFCPHQRCYFGFCGSGLAGQGCNQGYLPMKCTIKAGSVDSLFPNGGTYI